MQHLPKPLRLGVIGLGRAFSLMEPTLAHDPRIKLIAGCDPRPEARDFFARHYNATGYANIEDLCAADLDVIYIASPHQYHRQHAETALRHGKHILVEKPMALSLEDCAAMIEAADKAKCVMIIGHSHSFDLPIRRCAQLIAAQTYGRLQMIHALQYTDFLYRPRRQEELDTARGGGVIFNQAPHQIDNLRLLGGGRVAYVRAITGAWDEHRRTEGAYSALLSFENGAFANISYSAYAHFDSDEWMDWIAESGRPKNPAAYGQARTKLSATLADDEHRLKAAQNYGGPLYQPPAPPDDQHTNWHQHFGPLIVSCNSADLRPLPDKIMVYADRERHTIELPRPDVPRSEVIDELCAALYQGQPPLHDGAWALATMEVCLALLQSAREQRDIRLTKQKATPIL
jgi:phthalate 4,5-cis-dihydrodiol dehydrogenase